MDRQGFYRLDQPPFWLFEDRDVGLGCVIQPLIVEAPGGGTRRWPIAHSADVVEISGRRSRDDVPFGARAQEARRYGSRR